MLSGFDLYPRWVPLQYPGFTHLQVMFKNDYEDFRDKNLPSRKFQPGKGSRKF